MNITQASKSGGIVSNIGFDESELYSEWNAVSLRSLSAPVIRPEGGTTGVISLLNSIMNETIVDDALSIFPFVYPFHHMQRPWTIRKPPPTTPNTSTR